MYHRFIFKYRRYLVS